MLVASRIILVLVGWSGVVVLLGAGVIDMGAIPSTCFVHTYAAYTVRRFSCLPRQCPRPNTDAQSVKIERVLSPFMFCGQQQPKPVVVFRYYY